MGVTGEVTQQTAATSPSGDLLSEISFLPLHFISLIFSHVHEEHGDLPEKSDLFCFVFLTKGFSL